MDVIKKLLAKQHKCKTSDITIISPKVLPEVEQSTTIEVEYEINGQCHKCKVSVAPPILLKG